MIGSVIFAIHTNVLDRLARRGNKTSKQIVDNVKDIVVNSINKAVISNAYNSIHDNLFNDCYAVCYKGKDGRFWLGCWSSDTLSNNVEQLTDITVFDLEEAKDRVSNCLIKNNINTKEDVNKNRLSKETTDREQGAQSRGVVIKNTRGRVTVTSGQVSYKAINV